MLPVMLNLMKSFAYHKIKVFINANANIVHSENKYFK